MNIRRRRTSRFCAARGGEAEEFLKPGGVQFVLLDGLQKQLAVVEKFAGRGHDQMIEF